MNYKNYDLNFYIGNYFDTINKQNVFIIPRDTNLMLVNLFAKYIIILNIRTNKCKYYSINEIYNEDYDINLLKNINLEELKKLPEETYDFEFKNLEDNKNTILEINIFGNKIILEKINKNINIKNIIDANTTVQTSRGGTRKVYLLDEIVIKETDPTCDIYCELITNYFAKSKNVDVSTIFGLVISEDNKIHLVEKKYEFIDWLKVFKNVFYMNYFYNKWSILTEKISTARILGDYNLGNVLLDYDKLVITDFNGNNEKIILDKKLILSKTSGNNFILRILDYVFDNRISMYPIKHIEPALNNIFKNQTNKSFIKKILNNVEKIFTGQIYTPLLYIIFTYGKILESGQTIVESKINEILQRHDTNILNYIVWTILKNNGFYFPDDWTSKKIIISANDLKIIQELSRLKGFSNYIITVLISMYNIEKLKTENSFNSHKIKNIALEKYVESNRNNLDYLKEKTKYLTISNNINIKEFNNFSKYLKYKSKYLTLKNKINI